MEEKALSRPRMFLASRQKMRELTEEIPIQDSPHNQILRY